MTEVVWLASYPKSGNTWLRILIGCLTGEGEAIDDINAIADQTGTSIQRALFDDTMLIDSSLLTLEEIDNLRPAFHAELARDDSAVAERAKLPVRFVKTHDAYTRTAFGEPLLGGDRAAKGAILIVRDPRDVAPSLAHHTARPLDYSIDFMKDPAAAFSDSSKHRGQQLRQTLLDWSAHATSWLEQRDIPVHLLHYEDLKRDTAGSLMGAMGFAGVAIERSAAERAAGLAAFSNLQTLERKSGFREWRNRNDRRRLFFRRGEVGGWRDELSPQQAAQIEKAHGPMMARLGYELSDNIGEQIA